MSRNKESIQAWKELGRREDNWTGIICSLHFSIFHICFRKIFWIGQNSPLNDEANSSGESQSPPENLISYNQLICSIFIQERLKDKNMNVLNSTFWTLTNGY